MSYLPKFGEDSFIEGLTRTNAAHSTRVLRKPASKGLQGRLLPTEERAEINTRDEVLIKEDEDLVEWERQIRAYIYKLPMGREHRTTAVLVWEWATGLSVPEEHKKGNSGVYAADIRKINKLLREYFGKPYASYIHNRKFNQVYRISKHFNVDRKAPFCVGLYLEWRAGVKVR